MNGFDQVAFWIYTAIALALGNGGWVLATYLAPDDPRISSLNGAMLRRNWPSFLFGIWATLVCSVVAWEGEAQTWRFPFGIWIALGFLGQSVVAKLLGTLVGALLKITQAFADKTGGNP